MNRKTITETLDEFGRDLIDGDLADTITQLQVLYEKYKSEYIRLWFDSYYDDYYGFDITLYGDRPETDEEYKVRVDRANKIKAGKAAKKKAENDKQYAEYLKLKKKFENEEPYR